MMMSALIPVLLSAVLTGPFDAVRTYCREDFEQPGVRRAGNPEIVSGIVSQGLLTPTRQGCYRTSGELAVALSNKEISLSTEGADRLFCASFRLCAFGEAADLSLRFSDKSSTVDRRVVTRRDADRLQKILPVDIEYVVAPDGEALCLIRSLSDGTVIRKAGKDKFFADLGVRAFTAELVLSSVGGPAEATVDELFVGEVRESKADSTLPPYRVDIVENAEELKSKWPLVFEDEFEGPAGQAPDADKWYFPGWARHGADYGHLDGKGHLSLKCDFDPELKQTNAPTNLASTGLWSRDAWRYGYFEARLKFTRNNGWWSAFWLYAESNYNPMECGSEIDIYEDYYTRYADRRRDGTGIPLDHNLHVSYGGVMKSYNNRSYAPGSLDEFHTIGCKWTPFEVSIYVDGKLLKTTSKEAVYPTVTFDAFRHNAIRAPLHMIFSGCIMRSWGPRDVKGFNFPEYFLVDSVRVWAYPEDGKPTVSWVRKAPGGMAEDGAQLDFEIAVSSQAKVLGAYLFDNGACIASCTNAPWKFSVPLSKAYYEGTHFMSPGRQNKIPEWNGFMHSFEVMVQDTDGRVGATDERVRVIPTLMPKPQKDNAQPVPGFVEAARYDSGERGRTYWTLRPDSTPKIDRGWVSMRHSGEWLSCSVEVAEDGDYEGILETRPCCSDSSRVDIIVDGVTRATVECPSRRDRKWTLAKSAPVQLSLKKGLRVLTFLPAGYLSIRGLDLKRIVK